MSSSLREKCRRVPSAPNTRCPHCQMLLPVKVFRSHVDVCDKRDPVTRAATKLRYKLQLNPHIHYTPQELYYTVWSVPNISEESRRQALEQVLGPERAAAVLSTVRP